MAAPSRSNPARKAAAIPAAGKAPQSRPRVSAFKRATTLGPGKKQLPLNFAALYEAAPPDRVALIREGVYPEDLKNLAGAMGISQDRLSNYVQVPAATFTRKAARQERLSSEASERLIGVATLIGQVESAVERSGASREGFNAAVWTARWLEEPMPALGGLNPASYLDTLEGQRMVSKLIDTMLSGAYS